MYLISKRKQKSQRFGYTSGWPSYLHYHAAAPSSLPDHSGSPRHPGSVFIPPSSLWMRRRRVGGGARTVGSSSYSVKKREEKGVVERTSGKFIHGNYILYIIMYNPEDAAQSGTLFCLDCSTPSFSLPLTFPTVQCS